MQVRILIPNVSDIDVLVNNAGATWGAPIEEYPDAAFSKVMNLNVKSIFTLTQA
jgi:NAD(P)-dependent dehydrogenase (short-subunit alcohol dehydrogenase family)